MVGGYFKTIGSMKLWRCFQLRLVAVHLPRGTSSLACLRQNILSRPATFYRCFSKPSQFSSNDHFPPVVNSKKQQLPTTILMSSSLSYKEFASDIPYDEQLQQQQYDAGSLSFEYYSSEANMVREFDAVVEIDAGFEL